MHQLPESSSGRLQGLVMFLVGLGLAFLLKYRYDTGGSLYEILIFMTPACLILGLAVLIYPPMWKQMQQRNQISPAFAILAIVIAGAGIALRTLLFGGWTSRP